jgi:hypothetical protein
MEVRFAYRYRRRGGYIAELGRNRGLEGTPSEKTADDSADKRGGR